jgi:hypothetical protein
MRKYPSVLSLLVIVLLVLSKKAYAIDGKCDTVHVGVYVTSIHNIDFKSMEYTVTYWLWQKTNNTRLDLLATLEIPNAKSNEKIFKIYDTAFGKNVSTGKPDTTIQILVKMQSVMKDSWNILSFPLDRQRMWLTIENSNYDINELVFELDTLGKQYDSIRVRRSIKGWEVKDFKVTIDTSEYKTAFGYESEVGPLSQYSQFKIVIIISRRVPELLFLKIFLGMYIAFMIALICFYIQPANYDSRFQLSVGALFATIGNKYIVEAALPESTSFTLVDSLHALTLIFILFTIGATIVSLRKVHRKNERIASMYDLRMADVLLVAYISLNVLIVLFIKRLDVTRNDENKIEVIFWSATIFLIFMSVIICFIESLTLLKRRQR